MRNKSPEVFEKLRELEKFSGKEYFKKRAELIEWAISERYYLTEIGSWFDLTKQGVKMALIRKHDPFYGRKLDKKVINTLNVIKSGQK